MVAMSLVTASGARRAVASLAPNRTNATCGLNLSRMALSGAIPLLPPALYSSVRIPDTAVSDEYVPIFRAMRPEWNAMAPDR